MGGGDNDLDHVPLRILKGVMTMLFTEEQLYTSTDPFRILDETVYLTKNESAVLPQTIPVVENRRLQAYVIDFNGVRNLAESSGIGYLDAIVAITEADCIAIDQVCIAIDEAELIEDPSLINLGPVIIRPLSEYDDEFQFCLEVVEAYIDTDDENLLDILLETSIEDTAKMKKMEASSAINNVAHAAEVKKLEASSAINNVAHAAEVKKLKTGSRIKNFIHAAKMKKLAASSKIKNFVNAAKVKRLEASSKIKDLVHAAKMKKLEAGSKLKQLGLNARVKDLAHAAKVKKLEAASKIKDLVHAAKMKKLEAGSKLKQLGLKAKIKKMEAANAIRGLASTASERIHSAKRSVQSVVDKAKSKFSSITGIGADKPKEEKSSGSLIRTGVGLAGIGAGIYAVSNYRNKPKSVIAKRIAALRKTYAGFMQKAKDAPNEGIKNRLKKVASKILGVIDKLLELMQKGADKVSSAFD